MDGEQKLIRGGTCIVQGIANDSPPDSILCGDKRICGFCVEENWGERPIS